MASAVISDPRIGTELAGYRIEETLGRGGMGIVYLARDPWLDRRVALKLITPELAARASFRERFLRESQLAAPLEHAHVIPIYEAGEVDGVLYLAMRYVPGTDLGGLLDAGPLEPTRALAILEQVAIALDAAHAKGLVHRDVKPGNILLAQDEDADQISAVYLSDFGLTKHETDEVQLTAAEDVIGTLAYAAPEQIEGDEVGPAVDVYSLGCVLYECLVGDVPFPTESKMELLWAHLEEAPPRLSERSPQFPSSLDGVLARALAKSPGERFERCGEFVAAAWLALAGDGEASKLARRTRAAVPRRDVRNPYKGLRAFSEEDADDFFGREALTEEIADRLAAGERFLAIVGPSGSGKSSVVRAGLLPLLRAGTIPGSGRWPIVEFRPGARPVEELEAALGRVPGTGAVLPHLGTDPSALCREARKLVADSGASLLVVIDQFEELFTMTDDERRGQFLALLERAVTDPDSPVRVVVTLRADFYDRPLRVRGLSELVEAGHVAVHPLSPGELESAITSPAVGAGVELEQALVAEIVADVVDQPGALPLLQHALGELFERRDGRTLTEESYREIRGVGGALAARADELYETLDDAAAVAARRLFTRLVSLGEGVEDTRRRIVRSEVDALGGSDGAVGQVIDTYGRHRLLSFDRDPASGGPTVEIAHEALLREWPRLRSWIDDDRDGLRLLRQISEAAAGWDRLGRGAGDLYRGACLLQALDWQAERPSDMSPVEAEFLAESRELRDSDERSEQERVAHRLRQNRRLRVALAVVAVALIGAIVAGTLAFDQRGEAKQQTELAVAEAARATGAAEDADQQAAIAQEQAGVAVAEAERADQTAFAAENGRLIAESASRVVDDRRIALLLAAEAHRRAPGVDSLGALQRTLTASTGFLGYLGSGPAYLAVDFTASDQLVAVSERAIDTWDTGERRLVGRTELAGPITAAALSPSASLAAILTEDGSTQVVDTSSDATIATGLQLDESPTTALVLSPYGGRLATGHADGTVLLWNVAGGTVEHTIAADVGTIGALAFSPDGTRLASGQTGLEERAEPGVRVWDVATAKPIGERLEPNPPGPDGFDQQFGTSALVFSSDGSTLTTVGRWAIRRWSLDTSEMLSDFLLPGADRTGPLILSFRQLNDDLAAGMEPGGGLTVFDVITGELIVDTVDTQLEPIRGAAAIAVSGDSSTLVVAGSDGLGLWSLDGRQALARQLRAVEGLAAASFDAAGERLVASAIFERPLIWDLTVDAPAPREFSRPGFWTQYHDSGSVLINLAADPAQGDPRGADIPRWDILDPDTLEDTGVIFEDSPLMFLVEAVHRERGLLATSSAIWDLNTGAFLARLPVQRVDSFSRDGSRVTGVTPDGRALVFDTTSWEPVGDPVTSDGSVIRTAGYSPDGRFFFTADATGTITLRDPESHEPIGAPLVGHRAPLGPGAQFVYFSPESERLLSYSEDSEIILWNVETRQRIGGSWPADRPENVTAMSADGTKLLTVLGSDLLIWNLNTEEWYAVACRVAGRNFTRVEWEQLGPSGAEYAPTCPQWPLEQ